MHAKLLIKAYLTFSITTVIRRNQAFLLAPFFFINTFPFLFMKKNCLFSSWKHHYKIARTSFGMHAGTYSENYKVKSLSAF